MQELMSTKLFAARPFCPEDTPKIAAGMPSSAEELFLVSSSLVFPVSADALIKRAKDADPGEHRFYSVFLVGSDTIAGYFEIKNINSRHSIGTGAHILLLPDYRGKGMGKDLMSLIAKVAFLSLGLHRISLSVHITNQPAIAVYKKAGYVQEGLLREVLLFGGKRYSLYQMSLLQSEWKNDN